MWKELHVLTYAVLLHLVPSRGTGQDCRPQDDFNSPFIHSFNEQIASSQGCISSEKNKDGAEVHVFSLHPEDVMQSSTRSGAHNGLQKVTVHLKPYTQGIKDLPLIFVLHSEHPIQWLIQSENITNTTRHTFLINSHSKLERDRNIRIKIKKAEIPSNATELIAFVRSRYKAITSFTQVSQANTYIKAIGPDSGDPARCEIAPDFYSSRSLAAYLTPQTISGCVALWNEGFNNKDVHVVELSGTPTPPNSLLRGDVVMDLRGKDDRTVRNKYIVLILKSHQPVQWQVRSKGIRGDLDIIVTNTKDLVNTNGLTLSSVRVAEENLPDVGGMELVSWVHDHYGPAVSYSNVSLANKFDFIVNGADDNGDFIRNPPPLDLNPNQGHDAHAAKTLVSPFDDREGAKQALRHSLSVICYEQGMIVNIMRSSLSKYFIKRDQISLLDSNCKAQMDSRHFQLHTGFHDCGTQRVSSGSTITYANSVVLQDLPMDVDGANWNDDEGSALLPDDMASSDWPPPKFMIDDDEDFHSLDEIRLRFECAYHAGQTSTNQAFHSQFLPDSQEQSQSYHLKVYTDGTYQNPITTWPLSVKSNDTLHVQAFSTVDQRLQVVIDRCWLTPHQDPNNIAAHYLIKNGCKMDNAVRWPDGSQESNNVISGPQKFHFAYQRFFRADEFFLHCELNTCSSDGNYQPLVMDRCKSREDYCFEQNLQLGSGSSRKNLKLLTAGPFLVSPAVPWNDAVSEAESSPSPCVETVYLDGLDSNTVIGIAIAAFFIGVMLTGVLWFIHTHTEQLKHSRPRSAETSGESTPSSTAPIAVHHIHRQC